MSVKRTVTRRVSPSSGVKSCSRELEGRPSRKRVKWSSTLIGVARARAWRSAAPHFAQKRSPDATSAPQPGHAVRSLFPQAEQKLEPGAFSRAQWEQLRSDID